MPLKQGQNLVHLKQNNSPTLDKKYWGIFPMILLDAGNPAPRVHNQGLKQLAAAHRCGDSGTSIMKT